MIEKLLERLAVAAEKNNELLERALKFREDLSTEMQDKAPAAETPKKQKKEKPAPVAEVLPDPEPETPLAQEPEDDGLSDPEPDESPVTRADIRQYHRDQSAKSEDLKAKVRNTFLPLLTKFGALKDGKPNIEALDESKLSTFFAEFKAGVEG